MILYYRELQICIKVDRLYMFRSKGYLGSLCQFPLPLNFECETKTVLKKKMKS